MYGFNDLPNNKELRVYCSLGVASMLLRAFFYTHNIKPGDVVPADKKIKLYGRVKDHDELAYLWTSLMLLIPTTGRQGFSAKNIDIIDIGNIFTPSPKEFFNPSRELVSEVTFLFKSLFKSSSSSEQDELSSKFKKKSLYREVFMPVLGEHKVSYEDEEHKKSLAHQVPEDKFELYLDVKSYLCGYLISTFFKQVDEKPFLKFTGKKIELLHGIGWLKLAEMMFYIDPKVITSVNLSQMELNKFGVEGASLILNACSKMNELVLDSNSLHRLDPTGKIDHKPLCALLRILSENIRTVSLGNNGLSNFNKEQLLEIMNSVPASVTKVIIECNNLDPQLEKELIKSREKQPRPLLSVSDNIPEKTTQTKIPNDVMAVKLGFNAQTYFGSSAKQKFSLFSVPNASDEAFLSSNPPKI